MVAARTTASPGGYGPDRPSPARIHNAWQGGSANYEPDRAVAASVEAVLPQVRQMAADSVLFSARTAGYAAERGIRQFLVLGCGLQQPGPAVHQVARSVQPAATVAYVDGDASVTDELGDRWAGTDGIAVVAADPCDPGRVLASARLRAVIDAGRPVCVLASGVPHYLPAGRAREAVAGYARRLAPGSLVSVCVPCVPDTLLWQRLGRLYTPVRVRRYTAGMLAGLLGGLDLVPPGITAARWLRPGSDFGPEIPGGPCVIAAIGRKPLTPR